MIKSSLGFVSVPVLVIILAIILSAGAYLVTQKQQLSLESSSVVSTFTLAPTFGECSQDSDCKLIYSSCSCQSVSASDTTSTLNNEVVCKQNECSGPQIPVTAVCQQSTCVRSDQPSSTP